MPDQVEEPKKLIATVKLFTGRPPEADFANPYHDETGRFTTAQGSHGRTASKVVEGIKEGGATIDPRTGKKITTGFAVGGVLKSTKIPATGVDTPEGEVQAKAQIKAWLKSTAEKGVFDHPQFKVGAWFNDRTGRIEIEPAEIISNKAEANKAGRKRHQEGIADLSMFARGENGYISTEGSGRFNPAESPLVKVGEVTSPSRAVRVPQYEPKG